MANNGMSKTHIKHQANPSLPNTLRLGNLLADAMVDYFATSARYQQETTWAPAAIAVLNGGSIRASVRKGTLYTLLFHFATAFMKLCITNFSMSLI